ncbi:hypothetical protein A1O1_01478 [Capronia coronata CBS 617.96]|uniref:DCG1-like protein n=1 Tax=Capronia coronata CBS 617.96 TaxID=1182541 RepID=W9YU02_9EURO|nr:uncharacterized protein A1O1_01478 [Capronia coronata CBS 617.96]EXJ96352.1 hypothetical protein A1O1_01478 [Capronia coronata CBS 617.96]
MASEASTPVRILVINPNTSTHMTDALKPMVEGLGFPSVDYTYFTSPTPGIPSINSPTDAARSAEICFPALVPLVPHHDAFLVACYSAHPLVGMLKAECSRLSAAAAAGAGGRGARKYVTGIFEASCLASLALVSSSGGEGGEANEEKNKTTTITANENDKTTTNTDIDNDSFGFGIVSTGKVWETALQHAVDEFLGLPVPNGNDLNTPNSKPDSTSKTQSQSHQSTPQRFYGCETTGLNASELHDLPAEEVRKKMMDATKRLLRRGMGIIGSSKNTSPDETWKLVNVKVNANLQSQSQSQSQSHEQSSSTDNVSSSYGSESTTACSDPDPESRSKSSSRVKAICLGCAGMVGLDSAVRSACIEELGPEAGKEVYIVDGVKAGVGMLYSLARCGF